MFNTFLAKHQRRWRSFLILVTLILAFTNTFTATFASTRNSAFKLHSAQIATDMPVPAPSAVGAGRFRYFAQTGHFLRGPFFQYWETHGATPVLGLPITEAIVEGGLTVQYLERARLEWHPEFTEPRNQVLVTRLGAILTEARGLQFERLPVGSNTPTSFFFPETGHNLANAFLSFWQRNGGLAVFGYPISEEIAEVSPTDGRLYAVQYFERNRFEWHPELSFRDNVQLGLLGVEYARVVSLNPMSRILLPGPLPASDTDLSDSPRLAELVDPELLPAAQALGRTPQFRWVPAVLLEYNIPVQFEDLDEEGVAGAFITRRNRAQPYLIVVPESERGASLEAYASILAHEATHAYDVTSGAAAGSCSIEDELRAFMNGLAAWVLLKGPDALAQDHPRGSLDFRINRSFRNFLGGDTALVFDFDPQEGKSFLRVLYGPDCRG